MKSLKKDFLVNTSFLTMIIWIYDQEKFNETSLPEKNDFYSHLSMEHNSNADYVPAKRVFKDF